MRVLVIVGILLIVLGAFALIQQGITYTHREKVIDVGPIQATAEQKRTVVLPPAAGAAVLAGGIALLVLGARRSRG